MGEPDFVAATLEWCNSVRSAKGQEPLAQLPKGRRDDPESCPCGQATGLYVDRTTYGADRNHSEQYDLPEAVATFVHEFDSGMLPQYDEFPNQEEF